jgi:hypothetical protein
VFLGVATLVLLGVSAEEKAKEEKKPVEAEASKKQDKRGLFDHDFGGHDFGSSHSYSHQDFGHSEVVHHQEPSYHHEESHHHHHEEPHHHHHEEKTLTIVKKVPVPVPHYKTVHVPQYKEVQVPYHVKIAKPYPVVKHVSLNIKCPKVISKAPFKVQKLSHDIVKLMLLNSVH